MSARQANPNFRRFIQDRVTGEYYLGKGKWTHDEELAKNFGNASGAFDEYLAFCRERKCDFILKFSNPGQRDIRVPLSASHA